MRLRKRSRVILPVRPLSLRSDLLNLPNERLVPRSRRLQRPSHICNLRADDLVLDQWLPERLASQCMRQRLGEASPREDERRARQTESLRVEVAHHHREAIPLSSDDVFPRDADVLESDECRPGRFQSTDWDPAD